MTVSFRCPKDVLLGIEREVLRAPLDAGTGITRTDVIVELLREALQTRAAKQVKV